MSAQPCESANHDSAPNSSGPKLSPSATSSNALLVLVPTLAWERAAAGDKVVPAIGMLNAAMGDMAVAPIGVGTDPACIWSAFGIGCARYGVLFSPVARLRVRPGGAGGISGRCSPLERSRSMSACCASTV